MNEWFSAYKKTFISTAIVVATILLGILLVYGFLSGQPKQRIQQYGKYMYFLLLYIKKLHSKEVCADCSYFSGYPSAGGIWSFPEKADKGYVPPAENRLRMRCGRRKTITSAYCSSYSVSPSSYRQNMHHLQLHPVKTDTALK